VRSSSDRRARAGNQAMSSECMHFMTPIFFIHLCSFPGDISSCMHPHRLNQMGGVRCKACLDAGLTHGQLQERNTHLQKFYANWPTRPFHLPRATFEVVRTLHLVHSISFIRFCNQLLYTTLHHTPHRTCSNRPSRPCAQKPRAGPSTSWTRCPPSPSMLTACSHGQTWSHCCSRCVCVCLCVCGCCL
jgi:hypothetical protein